MILNHKRSIVERNFLMERTGFSEWVRSMDARRMVCLCAVLICIIAVFVPLVGAAPTPLPLPQANTTSYLERDNPELISALKVHVAVLGQEQQARMDGVIQYIDSISGGAGSYNLQLMEEDYLTTASSIPFMNTADEIDAARDDMRKQTQLFAEETQAQLLNFNGSTDAMGGYVNASVKTVEGTFSNLKNSLWLARDTARLTVFNMYSDRRTELLNGFSAYGMDVSQAKNLSDRIDAQRTVLMAALSSNKSDKIQDANSGIKDLNRQFRDVVQAYRADLKLHLDTAAILAIPD
jgi:hypothetical protein